MNEWLTKDPTTPVIKIRKGVNILIDYYFRDILVPHILKDILFVPHSWFCRFYGDPVSWFHPDRHYDSQDPRKYNCVASMTGDYSLFKSTSQINGETKRFFVFKTDFIDSLPF